MKINLGAVWGRIRAAIANPPVDFMCPSRDEPQHDEHISVPEVSPDAYGAEGSVTLAPGQNLGDDRPDNKGETSGRVDMSGYHHGNPGM